MGGVRKKWKATSSGFCLRFCTKTSRVFKVGKESLSVVWLVLWIPQESGASCSRKRAEPVLCAAIFHFEGVQTGIDLGGKIFHFL